MGAMYIRRTFAVVALSVASLFAVAVAAAADSWYCIDGFYLHTPDGISVSAPSAESQRVAFEFADERPPVMGFLIPENPEMSEADSAIVSALYVVRSGAPTSAEPLESIEIVPNPEGPGESGFHIFVNTANGWHTCYAIRLAKTPGGYVRSILLVPQADDADGQDQLERLVDELKIEIAAAAG